MRQDWFWTPSEQHFYLQWPGLRPCLSSAILNGGVHQASGLLNLQVDGRACGEAPEVSLRQYAGRRGWTGPTIGMMTAASMNSLRWQEAEIQGERAAIFVTCGLSNARCAGDTADWQPPAELPAGTINTVFITNLSLDTASMVELITVLTEAKSHVLARAGIKSPISGETATGTGTDSIAVIGGHGAPCRWFGKHTHGGQISAELLVTCLRASIAGTRHPA